MKKNKKGAIELSVSAIVILIMAIAFLSIGLVFIKGQLGKIFSKLDEQISQEPEPPKPTMSQHITLSRNPVISQQDTVETIKVSILNPSQEDWNNRQFIKTEGLCGKVDGICFIDTADTTENCDTKSNAKKNDVDCSTGIFTGMDCEKNNEKSPCLISNIDDGTSTKGDMYCPMDPGTLPDPNCEPKNGIDIFLICDETIVEEPFSRNIGAIKTGDIKTNILLLRLKGHIPDDQYLCQLRVFAEENEYMEDLVVKIKNE